MTIKINHKEQENIVDTIIWDRDSYFIDFNGYWSRFTGSIAQKIAERTTDNWNNFNLIRTTAIKTLGINPEDGNSTDLSSPINILPVNVFPSLLATALRNLLPDKNLDDLNRLFQELTSVALQESQKYIKDSIRLANLEIIKQINKEAKQILITNDSPENNDLFIKEANISNLLYKSHSQINKEQLLSLLNNDSLFITKNSYLKNSYESKRIKNILLAEEIKGLTFDKAAITSLVTINIDGASRGNPGPASIGIVFYKDNKIIKEISEQIGIKTNNHAEYTALIRALEICIENSYQDIEIRSDSELVVNQVNKKYKVKDADIKELFDNAFSLINQLKSFKITHVQREENLKADKLANNALKGVL